MEGRIWVKKALSSSPSRIVCSRLQSTLVAVRASHPQLSRASFVPRKQTAALVTKAYKKSNIKTLTQTSPLRKLHVR